MALVSQDPIQFYLVKTSVVRYCIVYIQSVVLAHISYVEKHNHKSGVLVCSPNSN